MNTRKIGTKQNMLLQNAVAGLFITLAACASQPPETFAAMPDTENNQSLYAVLTTAWPGPYGGLPPVDNATPATLEAAYRRAIDDKRAEIKAIIENPDAPTFTNTVLALETSGEALARIQPLFAIFQTTSTTPEIAEAAARLAPLVPQLDDDIAHNADLFRRVRTVHEGLPGSAPDAEARRLVAVIYEKMRRRGADLQADEKTRLSNINARLAELQTQFAKNANADEGRLVVIVEEENLLAGLSDELRAEARAAAEERNRPGVWAFPINRPSVWPVLTNASDRGLREEIWRAWTTRGGNDGEFDNAPVMTEILKLRGEKAKLLGYPTYAHYQTAGRMAGTPEVALEMMMRTWDLLMGPTVTEIAEMQALADAEGAQFTLQPWDRLYYAEKLKQQKFSFDSAEILPYLHLDNIVRAMLWAASETYGFSFKEIEGVPVVSDDIKVYEVSRGREVIGILYSDLYQRDGKGPASWASQYRSHEDFRGRELPLVALHSAAPKPLDGKPPLVPWERANVIFHEFGHTLHTLANGAAYPSLGSLAMPWDFIEVPSLLNEQWLQSDEVMDKFIRHHETGVAIPPELREKLRASLKNERVFSLTLNYLATAIVDMRLHLFADGREIDAEAVEAMVLEELGAPDAIDPILHVQHAFHTFTEQYSAGVYTYLWSDVIAADIGEAFHESRGGLYDRNVAKRYYREILAKGFREPTEIAFRNFRGRDPDPNALMRRFDLATGDD